MIENLIELVTQVANLKEVKDKTEPHVMQPLQLEKWAARRAIYSVCIILIAWLGEENNGS